jgi:hypothetical protein
LSSTLWIQRGEKRGRRRLACFCRRATGSQSAWERGVGAATHGAPSERRVLVWHTQIVVDVVVVDAVTRFAFSLASPSQLFQLVLTVLLQSGRGVTRQVSLAQAQMRSRHSQSICNQCNARPTVAQTVVLHTLLRKKTRPSVLPVLPTHEYVQKWTFGRSRENDTS